MLQGMYAESKGLVNQAQDLSVGKYLSEWTCALPLRDSLLQVVQV